MFLHLVPSLTWGDQIIPFLGHSNICGVQHASKSTGSACWLRYLCKNAWADKENPKAKDGPGPAPGSAQHAFFLLLAFYESASNLIAQVMSMTTYNRSCRKRLFEDLGFADTLAAYIYELVAAEGILNLWDPKGRIIQHYETRCPHFYGIFLLSPALMVFDMYLVERSKAVAAHFDAPNRKEQGLPLLFTLEGVPLPRTLNSSRLPSSLFEGLLDSLQRLIKRMENPATFEYYRNPDFRITEIMNGVIFRIAKMHGAPMTIKDHADVMRAKGKDAPLVCDGCGTKPAKDAKLSKCARCKVRWYCSRECQTTDWSSHKASCFAAE